jgi:hypothetical protein
VAEILRASRSRFLSALYFLYNDNMVTRDTDRDEVAHECYYLSL